MAIVTIRVAGTCEGTGYFSLSGSAPWRSDHLDWDDVAEEFVQNFDLSDHVSDGEESANPRTRLWDKSTIEVDDVQIGHLPDVDPSEVPPPQAPLWTPRD